MPDGEGVDREDIILHALDNAIIAYTYSVTRPAFCFYIRRAWVIGLSAFNSTSTSKKSGLELISGFTFRRQ